MIYEVLEVRVNTGLVLQYYYLKMEMRAQLSRYEIISLHPPLRTSNREDLKVKVGKKNVPSIPVYVWYFFFLWHFCLYLIVHSVDRDGKHGEREGDGRTGGRTCNKGRLHNFIKSKMSLHGAHRHVNSWFIYLIQGFRPKQPSSGIWTSITTVLIHT